MAESSDRPKSESQRIIAWYESDIKRYKGMIGQLTEYRTLVTQEFIDATQRRVDRLKLREERWNAAKRELVNED